jgi:CBS domain-containing protein
MSSLVEQAKENDNIGTIYLINDNNTLHGAIDLRDLLTSKNEEELEETVITSYPYVYADQIISKESLDELIDYDEDSIPVLSEKTNEVLGVITAQDLAEYTFEDMDEQPEEPEVVVPEKENKTGGLLLLCGTVLLIAAAIAGHTVVSDNVTRETAFIVLLVAGAVLSVVGLYYFYAKKKNE